MLLLALTAWTSLAAAFSSTFSQGAVRAYGAPEVFFGLHTYPPTMYDGIERYVCKSSTCHEIVEVNTEYGVGKLRNGQFIELNRIDRPGHQQTVGSLHDASQGRLLSWHAPAPVPTHVPDIVNYRFSAAQPISRDGTYVGLWHNSGSGTFGQTLIVLFNDRHAAASRPACGPYKILASVDQAVTILETRQVYHIGEAINLASYDDAAETLWVARMILSEHEPVCH